MFSILEINRCHNVADAAAKLSNLHMLGMNRISIERSSVVKDGDQTRVERTWQM